VPKQSTSWRGLRGREQRRARAEHLPLRQIEVQIAVVVVVEQRRARADDLGVVELPRHPAEVKESQRGFFSTIDEPVTIRRQPVRRSARTDRGFWIRRPLTPVASATCRNDNRHEQRPEAIAHAEWGKSTRQSGRGDCEFVRDSSGGGLLTSDSVVLS